MSKRTVTTLSILVSVALLVFYFSFGNPPRAYRAPTRPVPLQVQKLEPFTEVIGAPVKISNKQTNTNLEAFKGKPCEAPYTALYSHSLDSLLKPDSELEFSTYCKDYLLGRNYPDVIATFLSKCLDSNNRIIVTQTCKSLLIFVRSMAIAETFSDNQDLSQYDKNVLMNKLVWNYVKDKNLTGDMLDLNLRIADELIYQAPNLYSAYKAKFVIMLSKDAFYSANTPENEYLKVLDPMKRMSAQDETLKDGELLRYMSRHEYNNVYALSQELRQQNPKDYRGPYYESIYYWKTGKRQDAIEALVRASRLEPGNPMIQETLKKARTHSINDSIFNISFGFDFTSI